MLIKHTQGMHSSPGSIMQKASILMYCREERRQSSLAQSSVPSARPVGVLKSGCKHPYFSNVYKYTSCVSPLLLTLVPGNCHLMGVPCVLVVVQAERCIQNKCLLLQLAGCVLVAVPAQEPEFTRS